MGVHGKFPLQWGNTRERFRKNGRNRGGSLFSSHEGGWEEEYPPKLKPPECDESRLVVLRGVSDAAGSWEKVYADGDSDENDGDREKEFDGWALSEGCFFWGGGFFAGGGGLSDSSFFLAVAAISRFACSRISNCSFWGAAG